MNHNILREWFSQESLTITCGFDAEYSIQNILLNGNDDFFINTTFNYKQSNEYIIIVNIVYIHTLIQ